ncbi:MAG: hypothetical protein EBE86_028315 [Hormoscilla sp. GUM202]|nr:hypothetical protein [Hormoscilla sp. GUM202]
MPTKARSCGNKIFAIGEWQAIGSGDWQSRAKCARVTRFLVTATEFLATVTKKLATVTKKLANIHK